MLGSLIVILTFLLALASALRPDPRGDIAPHPYNNPYSDASAARDDRFL
ncbi:MAG TPA: hypothetical protein VID48_16680 [Solirubrobacteraceae bacterium]|jgi:hypothetical protein